MFSSGLSNVNGLVAQSIKAGDAYLWNGPVCPICRRGYCGQHTCTVADLQAQIDGLQRHIDALSQGDPADETPEPEQSP